MQTLQSPNIGDGGNGNGQIAYAADQVVFGDISDECRQTRLLRVKTEKRVEDCIMIRHGPCRTRYETP